MEGVTIVTGGAGFIGGRLTSLLAARGERVRVVEKPGAALDRPPDGIEVVEADIRDLSATRRALQGGRYVYHLAADPNLWRRSREEFDEINHVGARNVIESALREGAERVLHVSTESILTRADHSGMIAEDVEIAEKDAVGPYCLSKLLAEKFAIGLGSQGEPVVVANPTMPVGPGDRGLSPPTRLIRDFCRGKLPAFMDCSLNVIDVRDVAAGLVRVMERGRPGRRYLLGGENLTLPEFLGILSELTGVRVPRVKIPYPLGLAVAAISEFWADYVSGKTPKATLTGVRLTRRSMCFDSRKSLEELGLTTRPIRESLADAVAWLVETGELSVGTPRTRLVANR